MARAVSNPRLHGVLLAGGSGTRFWPLSRGARPKQLLALGGREPLVLRSWRRMRKLVPPRRLWVVAPAPLVPALQRLLPELRQDRLIVEPSPRDTAPAVALACATVVRTDPEAITVILPTDHVIRDDTAFAKSLHGAAKAAARGALVCLGVRPDRPATGFGYLRCARRPTAGRAVKVERFIEKPDAARARRFLRSGRYLWNAGMFVWRAERFLEELRRTAPRIARAVEGHLAGRTAAWGRATRRSVDYAVMEQAEGVEVVALDAGWDDVGSWDAAARLVEEQGVASGDEIVLGSPGSVVFGGKDRLIAVVDVPGVAVVETEDALLVVSRDSAEGVREVVAELRRRGRKDLL